MHNPLSLKKPIFLYDDRNKDLTLVVVDIIGASEKNLFVSAKYVINEKVRNGDYFNLGDTGDNEIIELLINKNNKVSGNDFDSYVSCNFDKELFNNFMYKNDNEEIDENLSEEKFNPPQIKCKISEHWIV